MSISKEERYALIRKAVKKVQKRNKIKQSSDRLTEEVVRLNNQYHKEKISWSDDADYAKVHYGDVYNANLEQEWS